MGTVVIYMLIWILKRKTMKVISKEENKEAH